MKKPILLVEDDPNDVLFMQIALEAVGIDVPLEVAVNGKQALDYLGLAMQPSAGQTKALPSLILLDLRLPQVPGHEVLQWVRQQPSCAKLPVIVLTSSNAETDIELAYQHGANSYIVKPVNPVELSEIAKLIRDYWLRGKQPPPEVDRYTQRAPIGMVAGVS
jgi:CheY-like chemotaxis protein